ncbi:MAG: N-acetyltransferase [Boseongicola sp.]|nr:N-acetyltransferase [Boseongicola sp.]
MVRPAELRDAPGIAAALNPVIRDTTISFKPNELSLSEVDELISNAAGIFVAEDQGAIIGYASYDQFRKGAGYARSMEHSIILTPDARGKGVGRILMRAVEDHARTAGVGSLWAGVSGENPGGVVFHARLGFETVAVLPKVGFKFNRWLDLTLMRKWLQPMGDDAPGSY